MLIHAFLSAEFSDDVLNRTSREWDRLMSNTSDQDNLEKMHNCASLVRLFLLLTLRHCVSAGQSIDAVGHEQYVSARVETRPVL